MTEKILKAFLFSVLIWLSSLFLGLFILAATFGDDAIFRLGLLLGMWVSYPGCILMIPFLYLILHKLPFHKRKRYVYLLTVISVLISIVNFYDPAEIWSEGFLMYFLFFWFPCLIVVRLLKFKLKND